jgi:hypothetical protein
MTAMDCNLNFHRMCLTQGMNLSDSLLAGVKEAW